MYDDDFIDNEDPLKQLTEKFKNRGKPGKPKPTHRTLPKKVMGTRAGFRPKPLLPTSTKKRREEYDGTNWPESIMIRYRKYVEEFNTVHGFSQGKSSCRAISRIWDEYPEYAPTGWTKV